MNSVINKIFPYLIIFIPISLISGPLIPEILMFLGITIFLQKTLMSKNYSYFKNKYTYFFLFFFFFINLRSLFTEDIILSIKSSLFYFRFYLLSLTVWYLLNNYEDFPKKFLKLFLISLFILILDSIIQFKFSTNILGWEKFHSDRISSFFGDELVLGSYLIRFLPLIVGLYIYINFEKFNFLKTIYLFIIIFMFYCGISISGDRTAFYLSLIFLPFLFKLRSIKYLRKKIYLLGFSFLIIISGLILSDASLKKRLFESTYKSMVSHYNKDKSPIKVVIFSHTHESHLKASIKIFQDNKLFGIGIKQFRNICKEDKYFIDKWSCANHPHNTYAQVLTELGLFGFSFLIIYFFYVILRIYKIIVMEKISPKIMLNYMILSLIFINLFPFSPSGNFFNNWLNIIYFFPLGFYFYSREKI